MPDKEKYIEVLSNTVKTVKEYNEDVPIKISLQCVEDILELLKEQEAVEPKEGTDPNESHWNCGACGYPLWEDENYCAHCGKPVLWEGREMIDREKVIKGLESFVGIGSTKWSPHRIDESWKELQHLLADALALLKEQEETELCDRCGRRRLKSSREWK